MADSTRTTRFRFWRRLIRFIGVIVPRRFRTRFRQEWEAELEYREEMLARWDRLDWRNKLELLWRSLGAFWDALWLQRQRLEEDLFQDIRYGLRMLRTHKALTAVAVFSIALGIGANTAIFSLIDAVLLKLLPVEKPEQLYFIINASPNSPGDEGPAPPYPCFERFLKQQQSFSDLAAFVNPYTGTRISIDGQVDEAGIQYVSGNFFSVLGINPALGRTLSPADDAMTDGIAAVISYNYWTTRFGQNPAVIGKVVQIGDKSVTIIGVTPAEFNGVYPGTPVDISVPIRMGKAKDMASSYNWWFWAVGRLKPGIEVEHARVELDTIYKTFIADTKNFGALKFLDRIELASASKGMNWLRKQYSKPLLALMAIVALVLLIACANVANLLLARATVRRKEFAVRLALGASRLRLLRQMLTESLLLVSLGGLLGLLFARWGSAVLVNLLSVGPGKLLDNPPLDHRVLLFTTGMTLLTGLLFGLAPALQAARIDPNPALKDSTGTSRIGRLRVGKSLVVAQVGISLLLLVGAGLFLRTLYNLKNVDVGFQRDGVLTMGVKPEEKVYQGTRLSSLWKELPARVERLPGVRSVSLSDRIPLGGGSLDIAVRVPGFTPSSDQDRNIALSQVSPGYFQTFGIALRTGRVFTDSDNETAPKVALLNESAARFYFGDRNPIGEQITILHRISDYQVVGVVKDSRYRNLREPDTRVIYVPILQPIEQRGGLVLAVRTGDRPTELINPIRDEVRAAGSDILLTNITTLSEHVDRKLVQERSIATLSLIFGLLALLLAAIGLYGVLSYDVARRTHEIGVRMALGASSRRVMQLVMRETLGWVVLGVTLGLGAALATTRWVESLLFGLKPRDPLTIGLAMLVLLAVAAVAGYLPARRAARVDPLVALRRE